MLCKELWLGLMVCAGFAMLLVGFAQTSGQGPAVAEGKLAPKVNLPAVNVATVLPDQKDAKTLALDAFRGKKNVVLFFFPKALTPG
ncbi:hypothetical protein HRbin36_00044 [bacterium HR36]|nr:hypothetical protein HRbin36_00044 [bacterium HR36]